MTSTAEAPRLPQGMDPAYYALSLLRRRRLDECVAVSTHFLNSGGKDAASSDPARTAGGGSVDEQLWCIQTKAMVLQSWFDDTEIDDDGVDDVLMEGEQAVVSTSHRPSTSLNAARTSGKGAPGSRAGGLGASSGSRPVSSRYGFARPGTLSNRPGTLHGGRTGTAVRPITGRFVRLGTASLLAVPGGPHINLQRLNIDKYAAEKPMVAKLLCDYLLYVEHKPKLALDLCMAALKPPVIPMPAKRPSLPMGTGANLPPMLPAGAGRQQQPPQQQAQAQSRARPQVGIPNADDWWWKARLAKANYQLGLLREAEKYFRAALFDGPSGGGGGEVRRGRQTFVNYSTGVVMELAKLYKKMDQPLTALELFSSALEMNCTDHHMLLCSARLYDELHDSEKAFDMYRQVLKIDSSNVEAIACIAAHYFYKKNQPEVALRFYRRLLQMGVHTSEIWNNIGLCAFQSSQLDFALSCFDRALTLRRDDAQAADIWYNIGHIGIGLGNIQLAQRGFRLAVGADPTHAESLNNLAVLELQKFSQTPRGHTAVEGTATLLLETAVLMAPELPEALYNVGLLAYKAGDFEKANNTTSRALDAFPDHSESASLRAKLREHFCAL